MFQYKWNSIQKNEFYKKNKDWQNMRTCKRNYLNISYKILFKTRPEDNPKYNSYNDLHYK